MKREILYYSAYKLQMSHPMTYRYTHVSPRTTRIDLYACIHIRTLKPGLAKYAVDANLFRLGSINLNKKFPASGCFLVGGEASHQKNWFFSSKMFEKKNLVGGFAPTKKHQGLGIFFRIGGP